MEPETPPLAPIEKIREQLEKQQEAAAELAEKALSGVDSVIGTANFYLAVIGIGIAVVAFVGGAAIVFLSHRGAKRIAEERINSYIKSDEMRSELRKAISDEVKDQIKERTFVMVAPEEPQRPQARGFPRKEPEDGGQQ